MLSKNIQIQKYLHMCMSEIEVQRPAALPQRLLGVGYHSIDDEKIIELSFSLFLSFPAEFALRLVVSTKDQNFCSSRLFLSVVGLSSPLNSLAQFLFFLTTFSPVLTPPFVSPPLLYEVYVHLDTPSIPHLCPSSYIQLLIHPTHVQISSSSHRHLSLDTGVYLYTCL